LILDSPYPGGVFHDTFEYDRAADGWTIRLEAAGGVGRCERFASYRATWR